MPTAVERKTISAGDDAELIGLARAFAERDALIRPQDRGDGAPLVGAAVDAVLAQWWRDVDALAAAMPLRAAWWILCARRFATGAAMPPPRMKRVKLSARPTLKRPSDDELLTPRSGGRQSRRSPRSGQARQGCALAASDGPSADSLSGV